MKSLSLLALPLALPLPAAPAPTATGIEWEASFEAALARAKDEGRVVFIAVNMDGERANDRLAKEVYSDKRIRELAGHTVPLVASLADHGGGTCSRFGALPCAAHREVDVEVRQQVLKPDAEGWVVAPQHVFLGPDGAVILSVPYEVDEAELEWCFVTALQHVDPEFRWRLGPAAKAPARLILGGVYALGADGLRPLTREQVLERIATVKKGVLRGDERVSALRDILSADEPEAVEFIRTELRAARGGGGRRGLGGGGDGEGRGGRDPRTRILHQIGVFSPRSYADVLVEWIGSGEPGPRLEAVVAMEQLGAPEGVKALQTALRKEKEPEIERAILRALGSAGAADKGARSTLMKAATKEKDPVLRRNAIVALGSLAPDEELDALLAGMLAEDEDPAARAAAALAMGMSRGAAWKQPLEEARKAAGEAQLGGLEEACAAALKVLEGGSLAPLRAPIRELCQDTVERERLFGYPAD